MAKIIYDCQSTRVPCDLVEAVKAAYEKRKVNEPKLRVIDVWAELIKKVKK
ncbi:hypothetical protein phiV208_35 [Vibrio phage phiV208]|nr:hypothetical protein phiV208_35 [Vibrio phage phiV208]